MTLSENDHLPFDKLMALSKVEGLRYPQPLRGRLFESLGEGDPGEKKEEIRSQ